VGPHPHALALAGAAARRFPPAARAAPASKLSVSRPQPRLTGALAVSAATHAGAAALFLFLTAGATLIEDRQPRHIERAAMIWFPRPGPDGGRRPAGEEEAPARQLRRAGPNRISVPAGALAPVHASPLVPEPPPFEPVAIAAPPSASALQDLPGALIAVAVGDARGGHGSGPSGVGQGSGRPDGIGIGDRGRGGGVVPPRLLVQVRPRYTADAMRARIQGIVALEAVVLADGTVGDVRVIRTLDSAFGLDREAIKAVKAWRFVPGTRSGRPVPVIVSAELTFTLR
jgi:protein TonB